MTDRERNETLLRLVAENPDLPIVAMVDCDIVGDDYGRWLASFGMCYVGEYALYEDRYYDDREEFKEAYYDYNDEPLCEKFGYNPRIGEYQFKIGECTREEYLVNCSAEKMMNDYLDKVAEERFTKAIIVNIDLP